MTALITSLIPVFLKVLGFILDRTASTKEQKDAYFKFIEIMAKSHKGCINLRDSLKKQHDANLKKIAEIEKEGLE